MKKKYLLLNFVYATFFIVLVLFDRITKEIAKRTLMDGEIDIIKDVLSFHYLENRGAAWGMFQNATWLFIIITVVVIFAMAYFYSRIPFQAQYRLLRMSIIILSAGAVGNFIDRIMWHYVIDFIYFKWINFPVFNVADIYVCISALLIIYCLLFKYKDEEFFGKGNRRN